jgi:CRP-like cAMP-binding protein
MIIKQADIFWGLDKTFVKRLMDMATSESRKQGDVLFREGDPARRFFILLKGSVKLSIGETGQVVYTVNHGGESIGWSSLIGRETYSATAECTEATTLLQLEKQQIETFLESNPAVGMAFFRHIAQAVATRLVHSYQRLAGVSAPEHYQSYGTGQVQDFSAGEV